MYTENMELLFTKSKLFLNKWKAEQELITKKRPITKLRNAIISLTSQNKLVYNLK